MAKGCGSGGCRHLGALPTERRLNEATLVGSPRTTVATTTAPTVPHWLCLACFRSFANRQTFLQHGRSAKHGLAWASQEKDDPSEYIFCVNCKQAVQLNELTTKERDRAASSITAIKELLQRDPAEMHRAGAVQTEPPTATLGNTLISSAQGPLGLHNLGNTCFMNASLQCLAALECLRWTERDRCGALSTALYDLLDCLRDPTSSDSKALVPPARARGRKHPSARASARVLNPSHFFDQLGHKYSFFERNDQQDSHDFLRLLFNALDDEVAAAGGRTGDAPHRRCFGGSTVVRVQCSRCRQVACKQEESLDLSLSLSLSGTKPQSLGSLEASLESLRLTTLAGEDADTASHCTVPTLVRHWRRSQLLAGGDAFACETCYRSMSAKDNDPSSDPTAIDHTNKVVYTPASCQYAMERLPRCLLLHLQRFSLHSSPSRRRGIRHQQHFSYGKDHRPVVLSLWQSPSLLLGRDHAEGETEERYRLRGMVIHEGGTADSGHYVCIVNYGRHECASAIPTGGPSSPAKESNGTNGHATSDGSHRWYRISDSSVVPISQATALSTHNAYMAFYELEPGGD